MNKKILSCLFVTAAMLFAVNGDAQILPPAPIMDGASANDGTRRSVTVPDMITMTQLAELRFQGGMLSKNDVGIFSPDRQSFLIVLKRGDIEQNTNDYWIEQFLSTRVFEGGHGKTIARFSSSSNRPAIHQVRWINNYIICFLAENPGEVSQLYSLDTNTGKTSQLTESKESVTDYSITSDFNQIIFLTEEPLEEDNKTKDERSEIIVQNQPLMDLITGRNVFGHTFVRDLYIQHGVAERAVRIPLSQDVLVPSPLALSPDGRYLVVKTMVSQTPPLKWSAYRVGALEEQLHAAHLAGQRQIIYQFTLVDLVSLRSRPLLDAPIPYSDHPDVLWSPDSKSIALSGVLLPLDQQSSADQDLRQTSRFLAVISIANGRLIPITTKPIRLKGWDSSGRTLFGFTGSWSGAESLADGQPITFTKFNGEWHQVPTQIDNSGTQSSLDIVLEEDMNTPPKLYVESNKRKRRILLLDLNPQFVRLRFGEVRDLGVITAGDVKVRAGIYLPVNYKPGVRYPLVIQTHEWTPERFWIDGPFPSAGAAQALAGRGFIVAQIALNRAQRSAPEEVRDEALGYDAVIDALHDHGMVDVNKIGIVGFSRSALGVRYALAHSKYHFAAATLADGSDVGFFRYIAYLNSTPWQTSDAEGVNGGIPTSEDLQSWFHSALDFDVAKVTAPIRLEAYSPETLLFAWEIFGLRKRIGMPVDFLYLPAAQHVLFKPSDRMASQQGNVDWFCFWLQGTRNQNGLASSEYERWEVLRRHHLAANIGSSSSGLMAAHAMSREK